MTPKIYFLTTDGHGWTTPSTAYFFNHEKTRKDTKFLFFGLLGLACQCIFTKGKDTKNKHGRGKNLCIGC